MTEIKSVTVVEEWGRVTSNGQFYSDARANSTAPGIRFDTCRFDAETIAVFLDKGSLSAMEKNQILATKPAWLSEVVFAEVESIIYDGAAAAEIEIGPSAEPTKCAFAIACIAESHGLFNIVPARYIVRVKGGDIIEVTLVFDWNSEAWAGRTAVHTSFRSSSA